MADNALVRVVRRTHVTDPVARKASRGSGNGFTLSAAGDGALSGSGDTGLGRGGRTFLSGVRASFAQFTSLFLGASPDNSPVAVRSDLGSPLRPSHCCPTSPGPGVVSAAVDPGASPRGGAGDSPAVEADTTLTTTLC